MTQDQFDILVDVISQYQPEGVEMEDMDDLSGYEFPNIPDRLKDGANLIELWLELLDHIQAHIVGELSDKTGEEQDQWAEDAEDEFWRQAKEVLVESDGSQDEQGTHVYP